MQAGRIAQLMGIPEVIVPISPGVMSAFGLLCADVEHESVGTYLVSISEVDFDRLNSILRGLRLKCTEWMTLDGVEPSQIEFEALADLRYHGQSYELTVAR